MFQDVTSSAVRVALDGLARRQRVTADNIANIETPGFLAGRVQFEAALRQAVEAGGGSAGGGVDYTSETASADAVGATEAGTARSLEPTRVNGNNVNLDHETLTAVDTKLRYDLMLRILDGKANTLGAVIKGGA